MTIHQKLFALQDRKFQEFHAGLCPTLEPETIIGVKTPHLRRLAREISAEGQSAAFLAELPHKYYEENQIHAFLISQMTDFNACLEEVNRFLPYVDNWATCDGLRPKAFCKHRQRLLAPIETWMRSNAPYTIRFGIEMLMVHFLEEDFRPEFLERVSQIRSEDYYVKMVLAWYYATALAKQYDQTLPYLQNQRLDIWVHNKTIQKARESYRIAPEKKAYLKTLKN